MLLRRATSHVRQEVLDFVCPTQQPEQLRSSLTKTVPKARIIPNKVVMQTKGDQYERWKQATAKELHAFLKTAWKEPTPETKATLFCEEAEGCDAATCIHHEADDS